VSEQKREQARETKFVRDIYMYIMRDYVVRCKLRGRERIYICMPREGEREHRGAICLHM